MSGKLTLPKVGVVYKWKDPEEEILFILDHRFWDENNKSQIIFISWDRGVRAIPDKHANHIGKDICSFQMTGLTIKNFSDLFSYATLEETKNFVETYGIESYSLYNYDMCLDLFGYYTPIDGEKIFGKVKEVCPSKDEWYRSAFFRFIIQKENMGE